MSTSGPPTVPKIYHITHLENLPSILTNKCLYSDSMMHSYRASHSIIGMSDIKQRRFQIPVECHAGTYVAQYVPFYFCPRSVMLFVIKCQNHPSLTYAGGQGPIVHLEADLHSVVKWADHAARRWAFTLSNAGSRYVETRTGLDRLGELNWTAIGATQWSSPELKEGKQAEFLVHNSFPWRLIARIGTIDSKMETLVEGMLANADHKPLVHVVPAWYY